MATNEKQLVNNRKQAAKLYAERRAMVDRIKMDAGCKVCGYNEHPAALDFDHRDPATKKFRIAGSLNRRLDTLLEEIAKCDVLCAICHRIKTFEEGDILKGRDRPDYRPKGHYADPIARLA